MKNVFLLFMICFCLPVVTLHAADEQDHKGGIGGNRATAIPIIVAESNGCLWVKSSVSYTNVQIEIHSEDNVLVYREVLNLVKDMDTFIPLNGVERQFLYVRIVVPDKEFSYCIYNE